MQRYMGPEAEYSEAVRAYVRIKKDDLVGDYELWYLFQIPSGKRIVEFQAFRHNKTLNLTAPD